MIQPQKPWLLVLLLAALTLFLLAFGVYMVLVVVGLGSMD
jgi:hypothetical protein